MERELELAKLRRLRRRADYPLGLFLAAIGQLHWVEARTGGAAQADHGPVSSINGRSEARGCPYCGRSDSGGRGRRADTR